MKIAILYFSQTGNTRRVANVLASTLRRHFPNVDCFDIQLSQFDPTPYRLIGIGSPCFNSKAATPIKHFLHFLPPFDGKFVFVFATSGGAPGRVLFELAQISRKKGATVIGGFLSLGEIHHPLPSFQGRHQDRPNGQDLARAREFAEAVAKAVQTDLVGTANSKIGEDLKPHWGYFDFLSLLSNDQAVRYMMPEPIVDHARCERCGTCAVNCPMDNIRLVPTPQHGDRCIRCYRCHAVCPEKAITISWDRRSRTVEALYHPRLVRWFGRL